MKMKRIGLAAVVLVLGAFAFLPLKASLGSPEKQEIEKIVHEYLVQNPEVIKEALEALQQKEAIAKKEATIKTIKEQSQDIFQANSPALAPENAKVTIVEFFDYQCRYCRKMREVMDTVIENNPDVKIIYKDLPILGGHSVTAAKAALAAQKQAKYHDFHNALMAQTGKLSKPSIMEIAKQVGLDTAQLEQDMEANEINEKIQANVKLARDLGIRGIPAIIVTTETMTDKDPMFFPGSVSADDLQKAIDSLKVE